MQKQITSREKNTYIFAAAGQGAIYAMISSWLLRYFTDVLALELSFVMALMWFAKILNAFADPVVGVIVDRTHSRKGKMRPYLKYAPFIISILSILLFVNWHIKSQAWRCIYVGITYVAWGIAYSVADVPLWGLPCAMTQDSEERDKLFSLAKFLNSLGGAMPTVVVSLLMSDKILGLESGIFYSALGIVVISCIPFGLVYPNIHEKHFANERTQNVPILKQMKLTFSNKILILVILCGIIGFGRYLVQAAYTYAAEYVFFSGNEDVEEFKQVIGFAVIGIGMLPTMLLTPMLIKKYSYKWIMIYSGVFAAGVMAAFYFVEIVTNYNFYWAILFLFLSGLPLGIINIVVTSVVGECVDYLEWKENIRLEGMTASMSTFMAKIGNALAAGIIPLVLLVSGYVENQPQTVHTKNSILMLISLIPAGSLLLSIVPMLFYDFVGKKRETALAELAERRGTSIEEVEQKEAAPVVQVVDAVEEKVKANSEPDERD